MLATGKAKTMIWRWQERFQEAGIASLWRDKTRPLRIQCVSRIVNFLMKIASRELCSFRLAI